MKKSREKTSIKACPAFRPGPNFKLIQSSTPSVIPSHILADLSKGKKVKVYNKQGKCCGWVFWNNDKLRFTENMKEK